MSEPQSYQDDNESQNEKLRRILDEAKDREFSNMINFYQGEFPNEDQETE